MTDHLHELDLPEDKKFFNMAETAEILGVKPYILRYWESEFKVLSFKNSSGRHRLYSRRDVGLLATIKALLYEQLYTVANARTRLQELVSPGGPLDPMKDPDGGTARRFHNPTEEPPVSRIAEEDPFFAVLEGAGEALLEQELEQARAVIHKLTAKLANAEETSETALTSLAELQRAHREVVSRMESLEHKLREARANIHAQLDVEESKRLRAENTQLSDKAHLLKSECTVLKTRNAELLEALEKERHALHSLREEVRVTDDGVKVVDDVSAVDRAWSEELDSARLLEESMRRSLEDETKRHHRFLKLLRGELSKIAAVSQ